MPRNAPIAIAAAVAAVALLAACSSSSTPTARPTAGATKSGSVAVESNPPGDIPDNQAFVPYRGSGFTVTVPEGWTQNRQSGSTQVSDKYNNITITPSSSPSAPTTASVKATTVPKIRSSATAYKPGSVTEVRRKAGTAVLVTYRAQSPVNPVTGKVVEQDVERYEFWRSGRSVVITLAAAVGSDSVDPWRTVTDSFSWTGK